MPVIAENSSCSFTAGGSLPRGAVMSKNVDVKRRVIAPTRLGAAATIFDGSGPASS